MSLLSWSRKKLFKKPDREDQRAADFRQFLYNLLTSKVSHSYLRHAQKNLVIEIGGDLAVLGNVVKWEYMGMPIELNVQIPDFEVRFIEIVASKTYSRRRTL